MRQQYTLLIALCCLNVLFFPFASIGQDDILVDPTGIEPSFRKNTLILKVKEVYRNRCSDAAIDITAVNDLLEPLNGKVFKKFPYSHTPALSKTITGRKRVDISLIYELNYESDADMLKLLQNLSRTDVFEYVEPAYIYPVLFTPNDPDINEQWHLAQINAFDAWDITTGSSDVVIAIIDTGVDTAHVDLKDKIARNENDPINGVDDDNDGYIDNYWGWNLRDDDNDPHVKGIDHGVHVSGCASPQTDNGAGIAGPGFNSKILAVKAGSGLSISHGYEGIVYAADHGADIINCSWGGGFAGQFGQDVVEYATFEKDALVIGASGNNAADRIFYPASYDYVFSVGATNQSDLRASFSNYGYWMDIVAPGEGIYSTKKDGNYGLDNGTSMAAPVVAGCAALVKSMYPTLNALQIGEQLRVTAHDIYNLPDNAPYLNKLGSGRVDLLEAVSGINSPSVVWEDRIITDGNDETFLAGDTLSISGLFVNYLSPTGNLTATITSLSPTVEVIDESFDLGVLSTLSSKNNHDIPFLARIVEGTEINENVDFRIDITDGTYSREIYFSVKVNVDYVNISINDVGATITSKGVVGYNTRPQMDGIGFTYLDHGTLLFEAGLMIGIQDGPKIKVVDNVTGTVARVADRDLVPVKNVEQLVPSVRSDFDAAGIFNDSNAQTEVIGLEVAHSAFAWKKEGHRKYIMLEYDIKNTSGKNLIGLYAGISADWDIVNSGENKADFDVFRNLGYSFHVGEGGLYTGVQVLTPYRTNVYSIDNGNGGGGGINVGDDDRFSTEDKYIALTTTRANAGAGSKGGDVIQVVSTGSLTLAPGQSVTVAFAMMAGDNLLDLQATADSAYKAYNGKIPGSPENTEFILYQNFPNPSTDYTTLQFDLFSEKEVTLAVYDVFGQPVDVIVDGRLPRGRHSYLWESFKYNPGNYFYRLDVEGEVKTLKMIILN